MRRTGAILIQVGQWSSFAGAQMTAAEGSISAWPPNKAFKLTRSHGPCRMEALCATMRRHVGTSQLNALFCGLPGHSRGAE
jgi:hypothetical protein